MKKILFASILLASCGRPESDIVHPVVDPVAPTVVPLSKTDLIPKRWTTQDNQELIMIDLEPKFGTDEYMFHFRLCADKDCFDYKFFAVGTFTLKNTNDMCFSKITYWEEPPPGFIIQSTDDFCGYGVMSSGVLKVRFTGKNETKNLSFTGSKLPFYTE